jgi:CRISPR type IV-associated protein Csf2
MTKHTRIEGVLRLKTPLHCASGEDGSKGKDGSKAKITATMRQPVITRTHGLQRVPYFPANDLAGRLRREGARALMDSFAGRGIKISRELYTGLTSGMVGASPEAGAVTVEEVARGRAHVFMGTFGGGARLLRKKIRLSDLFPIIAATVDAGCVPTRLANGDFDSWLPVSVTSSGTKPLEDSQLLHKPQMLRVDDLYRNVDPAQSLSRIDNALDTIAIYQAETAEQQRKRSESKAATAEAKEQGTFLKTSPKEDVGNMYSVEAIAAGTPMYFRLDMADDMTAAQIGLVARCVQALVNRQDLGGLVRNGYGRFSAHLMLTYDDKTSQLLVERSSGEGYDLAGLAAEFQEATSQELDAVGYEDMLGFYTPRKVKDAESAPESAAKGGKTKAPALAGGEA